MQRISLAFWLLTFAGPVIASADEPATLTEKKQEHKPAVVKTTFLITGLHCPACTKTVEQSLQGVKGVKSAKVNWNSKNAHIEFDEQVVSAQRLSSIIAGTPHMMGGEMKYGGWLALKVSSLKADDAPAWNRLKETLGKVPGVKRVAVYQAQSSIGVEFVAKGDVKSQQLIAALAKAGFKASNY